MNPDKREQLLVEMRPRMVELAMLNEIPTSRRTGDQQDRINEIYALNTANFTDYFSAIADHLFFEMMGWEDPLNRWESIYQDSTCKPPMVTNTTHTRPELEILSTKIASAATTVGGALEEIVSFKKDFDDGLDELEATFRAVFGFDRGTKAKDLFMALVPGDILLRRQQVNKYHAIFTERKSTLKTVKEAVSQLINVNEETPKWGRSNSDDDELRNPGATRTTTTPARGLGSTSNRRLG